jgi:fatty-acyl-CoA synthase
LINTPPNPDDSKLTIDYAFGNGMRSDVWAAFQSRYNIKRIIEFYSATEANVALFNSVGRVGALGCVPRILDFLYPVK